MIGAPLTVWDLLKMLGAMTWAKVTGRFPEPPRRPYVVIRAELARALEGVNEVLVIALARELVEAAQ